MTCAQTSTLGVYLLGALEPEDRSSFEAHLASCDTCRSELVRLAPLPGLLNQITPADFDVTGELPILTDQLLSGSPVPVLEAIEPPLPMFDLPPLPPVEPEPATPAPAPAPPPGKRYWLVAAAAALVLAVTVGGIVAYQAFQDRPVPQQAQVAPPPAQVDEGVAWSATDPNTGIRADVRLIARSWGTEFKVWMFNVPSDKLCRMRVVARTGYKEHAQPYREVAGWWATSHAPDEMIPGSTSIEVANIYYLEFLDADDNMLVQVHAP
jgi:hypothetical protein